MGLQSTMTPFPMESLPPAWREMAKSLQAQFESMDKEIRHLSAAVEKCQEQSAALEKCREQQVITPPAPFLLKIPFPDMFCGDRTDLRRFLDSCKGYFELRPSEFLQDKNKILFTAQLLEGSAYSWFSIHLRDRDYENNPLLRDWSAFEKAIMHVYGVRF